RWVGPVAAIALVALMGYGVVTSASTSGVPKVAPAPTTTAHIGTPTTAPVTTTTIPQPIVPFYAAAPPRQYGVRYADLRDVDSFSPHDGGYQLWTTPNASSSTGSWFSIETFLDGSDSVYATNAVRLEATGDSFAISHTATGQTVTQAAIDKRISATITSFGLSDDDVVRLAQSISGANDPNEPDVRVNDASLIAGYQMVSSVHPSLALQGTPAEQVYYEAGGDSSQYFSITVSPRPPSNEGGSTLDRQLALRFYLDQSSMFDVDGHIATAGFVVGQDNQSIATWIAGDHIVTVSAQLPVADLISIAQTVHQVSPQVWAGMQFQASHNGDSFKHDYKESPAVAVAAGNDTAGQPWAVDVAVGTLGAAEYVVNWQWNGTGFSQLARSEPEINTIVDGGRTYVVASLPKTVAATAQLVVTRDALPPVPVDFVDTDPTFNRTFAAYAFSDPVHYTAQVIGTDGSVIAAWPPG
ncbi:MAG TPA: hypothetical protein VGC84_15295, partial [Ilumatobacteraceae bacterium]